MDRCDLVIGYPDKRSGLKQVKYKIDYGTDIRLLTLKEKKKSLATLESFGYVWDEAAMWVSAPRPRMRAGGTYWYITDRFTLRAAQDNQTPQHNQRYECGNYFLTPEDARELLNVILEKIAATRSYPPYPRTSLSFSFRRSQRYRHPSVWPIRLL